jgi:hypothetical protein
VIRPGGVASPPITGTVRGALTCPRRKLRGLKDMPSVKITIEEDGGLLVDGDIPAIDFGGTLAN